MTTSTEAGLEAWEYTPPTEDGNGVVSPPRGTTPWWTAIIIADDETSARVGPMLAAALAMREALEMLVEEKVDYMTINHLGDPETQHTVKAARAALAQSEGR